MGARSKKISACEARGPGPQSRCSVTAGSPSPRSRGAHQIKNGLDDAVSDRQAAREALRAHQRLTRHHRTGTGFGIPRRLQQDAPLGIAIGVVDVDLKQKTVELGLRQRIGALLLDGILAWRARGNGRGRS